MHCVIANMFEEAVSVGGKTLKFQSTTRTFELPAFCKEFVIRFDTGRYPDLVIRREDTCTVKSEDQTQAQVHTDLSSQKEQNIPANIQKELILEMPLPNHKTELDAKEMVQVLL